MEPKARWPKTIRVFICSSLSLGLMLEIPLALGAEIQTPIVAAPQERELGSDLADWLLRRLHTKQVGIFLLRDLTVIASLASEVNEQASADLDRIEVLIDRWEFAQAESAAREVVALRPGIFSHALLVTVLLEQRQVDKAHKAILRAKEQVGQHPALTLLEIVVQTMRGNGEIAQLQAKQFLAQDRSLAEAWYAVAFTARNDEEATEAFRQVLSIQPRLNTMRLYLTMPSDRKGKVEGAVAELAALRRVYPDDLALGYSLLWLYLTTGQPDRALSEGEQLLLAHPESVDLLTLVGVLSAQKSPERTLQCGQQAVKINAQAMIGFYPPFLWAALRSGQDDLATKLEQLAITQAGTDTDLLVVLGNTAEHLNQYGHALAFFRQTVTVKPQSAELHVHLGRILRFLHRRDEALESFWNALRLNPHLATAYNNLGVVYRELDRYAEAIEMHQLAITIDPQNAVAYCSLGHTLSGVRDFEAATQMYERAIQLDHEYAEPYQGLAMVSKEQGRVEEAIWYWRQAIRLDPRNEFAFGHLADIYSESHQYEEALQLFDQARQINPYYAFAYTGKAHVLQDMERYEEAIRLISEYLQVFGPDGFAYQRLAECYQGLNDPEREAEAWDAAAEYEQNEVNRFLYRGNALDSRGDFAGALKAFQAAITLKADYATAHYNLGNAYRRLKDYPRAMAAYHQVLNLDPTYSDAYHNLGKTYEDLNDPVSGLQVFRKAAEIDPLNPTIAYMLGRLSYDAGQLVEAEAAYTKAIELDPTAWDAHYGLALIAHRRGEYAQAVRRANQAIALSPSSYEPYWILIQVAYRNERWAEVAKAEDAYLRLCPAEKVSDWDYWIAGFASERLQEYDRALVFYRELAKRKASWTTTLYRHGVIVGITVTSRLRLLPLWHWLRGLQWQVDKAWRRWRRKT